MHQHPRSPAPPPPASATRSSRSEDNREQDTRPTSPAFDPRTSSRGLGIETGPESPEQSQARRPSKEAIAKLNQIISNYHTKAALIILHSRVELPPSFNKGSDTPRVNRWFNVELEDTDVLREQLRTWRTCDASENRPPPLIIETYLDTKGLTNNQSLVALDEHGKRFDVLESLSSSPERRSTAPLSAGSDDVILERWKVELGGMSDKLPTDLGSVLPTIYKKSIVLFRSLFTYSKFLPAWKFAKRTGRLRAHPALRIKYRISAGNPDAGSSKPDRLTMPLFESSGKVVETYTFGVTDSPAGPFSVEVTYRTSCEFRVDDSEALLSSRFMGADDEGFRPSLPSRNSNMKVANPEVGSVPLEKRTVEDPDFGRAYGSLSTFHNVGPTTSASPISALRAAQQAGATSPSPPASSSRRPLSMNKASPIGRAAILANEGSPGVVRRPSISFQPFKAPPLSASPSLVDPPLVASPRSTAAPRIPISEAKPVPPPSTTSSTRKSLPGTDDQTVAPSSSASPRPASIARYSSAFSHRRARPSSGNITRPEDDTSSGRASATSSSAQPGSGLLAEATGTSADSLHADDENISDFLKSLDMHKDLLSNSKSTARDDQGGRTTAPSAALSRFQRMKDSNAALSDSITSSLMLHRSSISSSRQLSSVPPMVAGTSISTASSPGKPISPHTPHTPAIPSRLSSNSIVDYNDPGNNDRRESHVDHSSPLDENVSEGTTMVNPSNVNAIDIPTSPTSLFPPTYRRPSSAAHRRRTITTDDEEIFPFNLRSISLGAEDRSNSSLSAMQRQHDYESDKASSNQTHRVQQAPPGTEDPSLAPSTATRTMGTHRGAAASGPSAVTSGHHVYQPRFSLSRGRGLSGPQSLSSGSGSLARGSTIPSYLTERDHDRDGNASGSNSGTSMIEGRRPSTGRNNPPQSQVEEDEPLLFAMSDFGASRRSFEEGRQGNHSADPTGSSGGSRRGGGRRGGGLSGFSVWP